MCSRCDSERQTKILRQRPGGHSPATIPIDPPPIENVCANCITSDEIAMELSSATGFVLGVLSSAEASRSEQVAIALDTARSFFVVRNSDDGRGAALRAIGFRCEEGSVASAK